MKSCPRQGEQESKNLGGEECVELFVPLFGEPTAREGKKRAVEIFKLSVEHRHSVVNHTEFPLIVVILALCEDHSVENVIAGEGSESRVFVNVLIDIPPRIWSSKQQMDNVRQPLRSVVELLTSVPLNRGAVFIGHPLAPKAGLFGVRLVVVENIRSSPCP